MKESKELRRKTMQAVKSKDTKPELIVRRLLHSLGYRYRLHRKDLPGKPDIVFSGRKKVIFIHGCFWHGHNCKRGNRTPATNIKYWKTKIERNVQRYSKQVSLLEESGWTVLTVWECELKDIEALNKKLVAFLDNKGYFYFQDITKLR